MEGGEVGEEDELAFAYLSQSATQTAPSSEGAIETATS